MADRFTVKSDRLKLVPRRLQQNTLSAICVDVLACSTMYFNRLISSHFIANQNATRTGFCKRAPPVGAPRMDVDIHLNAHIAPCLIGN